jgi:glycosyltransferase involved in cell wall biosynthesis
LICVSTHFESFALMNSSKNKKNLLIEGWRGVNHSFALVNQCQILELLKFEDLNLFHRDLPFAMAHWTVKALDAGFSEADRQRIDALSEPSGQKIDCVYRAVSPFGGDLSRKTLTFMVTELGLSASSFGPEYQSPDAFTRDDNLVVTPTHWAKARLVEYGFDEAKVRVIPHGVNAATFYPLTAEERTLNRSNLGLLADDIVFLNLGVATWNKGIDVLLIAFATLRARYRNLRLILKDQRGLYGISVEQVMADVAGRHPSLFGTDTLAAIQVVPVNLSQEQLRLLYGIADCYVSPYRAEGFNLPVLEAIACGTPVVVTDGGATDDFCTSEVGLRVASTPGSRDDRKDNCVARFCEPQPEALVDAMERFVTGTPLDPEIFARGRRAVVDKMTWQRAAQSLHDLI